MLSPRDAWHATLGQLELQLNRATFDTWLKGAELIAVEEGDFAIRVRHAYAKDWLEKHLLYLITQTLSNIYGQPVHVDFVVTAPSHASVQPQPGTLFASLPAEDPASPDPRLKSARSGAAVAAGDSKVEAQAGDSGGEATRREPASAAVRLESAPSRPKAQPKPSEWDPREQPARRGKTGESSDIPALPLNRRYTFESFVTGPGNQFACAAAKAVSQAPGETYNPLFLYGGTGLGKTHLLNAIGQACEAAGKRVVYVTAEAFTNDLVASIRGKSTAEFRDRYRTVDVLLVDDIHFIAGKTSTEEEFYHVFNTLLSQNSQIVLAGDQHPRTLNGLDDRLRCRFEGGLLADIQPPEKETRMAILKATSAAQGTPLPDDVAEILAEHETANVRVLEGLLTQVLARVSLAKEPLDADLARRVLGKSNGTHARPAPRKGTDLKHILEATATFHQLSMDDLLSKSRTKAVVRARHIAMYLAREETEASLPQIGEALGRNHSTILHGYKKIAGEIALDDELKHELSAIRRQLYLIPN